MSAIVRIVCRPEVAPGFALAGIRPVEAHDETSAVRVLRNLGSDDDVGVILVQESLYDAIPAEAHRVLDRRSVPIVAPFPDPRWDEKTFAEEYVLEILRRAIGYRVRTR